MSRIFLSFCISIAVVAVASAEPSATPNHIISHIRAAASSIDCNRKDRLQQTPAHSRIQFVNGALYRCLDVSAAVYRELMSAASKARFYDSNIRRHYRSILVRARQMDQTMN